MKRPLNGLAIVVPKMQPKLRFSAQWGRKGLIIGVVRDFHIFSLFAMKSSLG